MPFFVEELAGALESGGRLTAGTRGLELVGNGEIPVPETIRDAVLLRAAGLSDAARAAAEAASVAGPRFDLELVAALGGDAGSPSCSTAGSSPRPSPARGAFRHALARDAIYEDVPWPRRRALHRRLAEALEAAGRSRASRSPRTGSPRARARAPSMRCCARSTSCRRCTPTATRPRAARRRSSCGPTASARPSASPSLERYARSAELAGDLTRGHARVARGGRGAPREGVGRALADAQRHLASVYELRGDRERALAARRVAADSFATNGLPGDAAAERLVVAGYLQSAGKHGEAVALAREAGEEAQRAERIDLRARALGLEGVATAKGGELAAGVETVRAGLSLALAHELTPQAAELYQRLGTALETAGDYGGAHEALTTAVGLCRTGDADAQEHGCLSCMAYVLRELGDWDASVELCRELAAGDVRPDDALVADGILGAIHAFRGEPARARPLLLRALDTASRLDVVSMQLDTAASLGWIEEQTGDHDAAAEHCRFVLERWERSEDHHYAVWGLRWAACFFAANGAGARGPRLRRRAVARIAAHTGHPDALRRARPCAGRDGAARRRRGDRRRAARPRAGAAGHAGHPLRARADPAARRRRPRRRRRARARLGAPGRAPTGRLAASAPARWPCAPPRRRRAWASRSSAARAPRSGRARRRGPVAPRGRGRCACSPSGARTARSPASCSSARARWTRTCATSSRKLGCRSRIEAATRAGELGLLV